MSRRHFTFAMPFRYVLFQYRDVPKEVHAVCLETRSFGVGDTLVEAMDSLIESINAQVGEGLLSPNFLSEPDEEWERAYETGKHPISEDVTLIGSGTGLLRIVTRKGSARADVNDTIRLNRRVGLQQNEGHLV